MAAKWFLTVSLSRYCHRPFSPPPTLHRPRPGPLFPSFLLPKFGLTVAPLNPLVWPQRQKDKLFVAFLSARRGPRSDRLAHFYRLFPTFYWPVFRAALTTSKRSPETTPPFLQVWVRCFFPFFLLPGNSSGLDFFQSLRSVPFVRLGDFCILLRCTVRRWQTPPILLLTLPAFFLFSNPSTPPQCL